MNKNKPKPEEIKALVTSFKKYRTIREALKLTYGLSESYMNGLVKEPLKQGD